MNVWGVTFGGYLAKILSFKSGNLLYKSNFYLLSEGTVLMSFKDTRTYGPTGLVLVPSNKNKLHESMKSQNFQSRGIL